MKNYETTRGVMRFYYDYDSIDKKGVTHGWHIIEALYSREVFRGSFEECLAFLEKNQEVL